MKEFALAALAIVLLVSACVKPAQQPAGGSSPGALGVQAQPRSSGLGDLPNASGTPEDSGLSGQQVDLGPLV